MTGSEISWLCGFDFLATMAGKASATGTQFLHARHLARDLRLSMPPWWTFSPKAFGVLIGTGLTAEQPVVSSFGDPAKS
jgi:hypothetical protein